MLNRFQRSTQFVITLVVLMCAGCNRIVDQLVPGENLNSAITQFDNATRMVIRAGDEVKKDTTDRREIADVTSVFRKYPSGWMEISGGGGDYNVLLYQGSEVMWRIGFTAGGSTPDEDTLDIGPKFRRVPKADVSAVMTKVGLPWPIHTR